MASYPTAALTDQILYVAVNNAGTILTAGINSSVLTIPVASTALFPADGVITIGAEAIHYTSKDATNFLGATRGFDGTTNVSHSGADGVYHMVVATHHNSLKDEVIAIGNDMMTKLYGSNPILDVLHNPAGAGGSTLKLNAAGGAGNYATVNIHGASIWSGTTSDTMLFGPSSKASTYFQVAATGVYVLDGTAATPAISFLTDPDTGFYRAGNNRIGIAIAGTQYWTIDDNIATIVPTSGRIYHGDGAAASPAMSFTNDTNTGFYRPAADHITFTSNGINRWTSNNAEFRPSADNGLTLGTTALRWSTIYGSVLEADNGSVSVPSFAFSADVDTGLYLNSTANGRMAAGGVVSMGWDNSATAGRVRLLVYDVDNATLEPVTVGAADSGGAGYKVLRILN